MVATACDWGISFAEFAKHPIACLTLASYLPSNTGDVARKYIQDPELLSFIDIECYCWSTVLAEHTPTINAGMVWPPLGTLLHLGAALQVTALPTQATSYGSVTTKRWLQDGPGYPKSHQIYLAKRCRCFVIGTTAASTTREEELAGLQSCLWRVCRSVAATLSTRPM